MRALTQWRNPQLGTLRDEIDEIFDRFFVEEFPWHGRMDGSVTVPVLESFLRDDRLVVRADLPGIDAKAVEVSVEGDRLTVRGERKDVNEDKDRLYKEVRYGRFERMIQLPPGVDPDTVRATYQDGVLEITMAAPKGLSSKRIPIETH